MDSIRMPEVVVIIIILLIVLFACCLPCAILSRAIAQAKGYYKSSAFWEGIWFSWYTVIYYVAIPEKQNKGNVENE